MEVQRERPAGWEQDRGQGADPPGQQAVLLPALRAVGVVGREGLLGQDIQPGEQPQGRIPVEVVDGAAPLLVEQFQSQQAQHGAGRWDHA
jgi:hypothetical protein